MSLTHPFSALPPPQRGPVIHGKEESASRVSRHCWDNRTSSFITLLTLWHSYHQTQMWKVIHLHRSVHKREPGSSESCEKLQCSSHPSKPSNQLLQMEQSNKRSVYPYINNNLWCLSVKHLQHCFLMSHRVRFNVLELF